MNCTNVDLDLFWRRRRACLFQVWVHVGRRENRVCCELLPLSVLNSCSDAVSSSSLWLLRSESEGRFKSWCSSRSRVEPMASHVDGCEFSVRVGWAGENTDTGS